MPQNSVLSKEIVVRFVCFLFLIVLGGLVAAFAYFNQSETTLRFADWSLTTSVAVVAGITYLAGMLSGWTVIGMVRRSANRVAAGIEHRYAEQR